MISNYKCFAFVRVCVCVLGSDPDGSQLTSRIPMIVQPGADSWEPDDPCRSGAWARHQGHLSPSKLSVETHKVLEDLLSTCGRMLKELLSGIIELNCSCGNIMNVHLNVFTLYPSLQLFKRCHTVLMLPKNLLLGVSRNELSGSVAKGESVPSARTSPSSSCWSTPGLSRWSLNPEPDWRLCNRPSLRGALSPVWDARAAGSARRRRSRPPGERPEVSAVWAPGAPAQASQGLPPFRFHSETCSRRQVQRAKVGK